MFEVRRTAEFIDWLTALRDIQARARIAKRIDRIAQGNFGDAKPVGDGVSELRFDFGPGYRVYYTRRGDVVVILLCGGDKDSQPRDIERAKQMAREIA
jgi:putative addiction module killer protein